MARFTERTKRAEISVDDVILAQGLESTRVLMIEDNRADAKMISLALQRAHGGRQFDICVVPRLADAIDRLGAGEFDLVLMDLNLPDNHETAAVAVLHNMIPHTPIIVYSGVLDSQARQDVLNYGAKHYLSKGCGSVFPLRFLVNETLAHKEG